MSYEAKTFFSQYSVYDLCLGLTSVNVRFVRVLWKILFKCHVIMYVVWDVQIAGLKIILHVQYAQKKLVPILKSKSARNAGAVQIELILDR